MFKFKLWLIILGVILITLNKYSFVGKIRDSFSIYLQENVNYVKNKIIMYPKLVLLNSNKQKSLEIENSKLKQQLEKYALLAKEEKNQNQTSTKISALKNSQTDDFKSVIARAIIDVNYLVNNKLLINKGSNDGIKIGDTVINKDGVIGQISNVNKSSSQITLLTNNDFKIYLEDTNLKYKMLANGIGNNHILVKYIDKNAQIAVGDILITTGLDDLYPANIPVAKIIKIFREENGFNSALCAPVVNFNELQYLMVLESKEHTNHEKQ